jgi:lipoyl-dependent peroxiredoxin
LGTAGEVSYDFEYASEEINATATIMVSQEGGGFSISGSHLDVEVTASGLTEDVFAKIANDAKDNCPISEVLRTEITLNARVVPADGRTVAASK